MDKSKLGLPLFGLIRDAAGEMGIPAYVVGGFVRDLIMGRPSSDIDIVAVGDGIGLAQRVAGRLGKGVKVHVFRKFGTAMLVYGAKEKWNVEFVGARKESYASDSRKPEVAAGSLEDDQNRRDFTINALAMSLQARDFGDLADPFGGVADIGNRIIRTPRDPDITFSDDPLRMMRAVRFATQLGFTIEEGTFRAIGRNAARIDIVSMERITDELNKIILSPRPSTGFRLLDQGGLLGRFFPQLLDLKGAEYVDGRGHKDNFYHTLQVLDNVSRNSDNLWLRWAALLHDIGKPATKKYDPAAGWTFYSHDFVGARMVPGIFEKLRLPLTEKMKYVRKLVLLHLRPIALTEESISDSAVRRLLFDAGDDIDDLMTLCEADITSKIPSRVKLFLENFSTVRRKLKEIEEKDKLRNWQPPIRGEQIMETFGLQPCEAVGLIKDAIREAILDGKIGNNYEEAFAFMIEAAKSLGLAPVKP